MASVAAAASHFSDTADMPFAGSLQQPLHSPHSASAGLADLARCTLCFGIACRLRALGGRGSAAADFLCSSKSCEKHTETPKSVTRSPGNRCLGP